MSISYTFPPMDLHYHSWEQHSSPFSTSSIGTPSDQSSIPPITQRSARTSSDIPRSRPFMHPLLVGHSARAGISVPSTMIPAYPGRNARALDRLQAQQAYYQQQQHGNSPAMRTPVIPVARRSSSHRGISHIGPVVFSSDQTGVFYFFPPRTSGLNCPEPENPPSSRIHVWERDHLTEIPVGVHSNRQQVAQIQVSGSAACAEGMDRKGNCRKISHRRSLCLFG